jgi:serralysin
LIAQQRFSNTGWKEGRNPNALFDTKGYLRTTRMWRPPASTRWRTMSRRVGRKGDPSASFDTLHYLQTYPEACASAQAADQ